jgi:hypothetical protein
MKQKLPRMMWGKVMRSHSILLTISLIMQFFAVTGIMGQQIPQGSYDVPVVLTQVVSHQVPRPHVQKGYLEEVEKEELVRDFGPMNFQVQVAGVPARVQGVSIDKGPKRIVFVLDGSEPVPKKEWESEIWAAKLLLGYARSIDKFAVVLVGTDTGTNSLMSPNETKSYLGKLLSKRPTATDPPASTNDSLLTAASRLDPPQFGDVVILFGRMEDATNETTLDDVRQLFLRKELSFYGLSFKYPEGYPPVVLLSQAPGFDAWMETPPVGDWYGIIDFESWYNCIAEPYRLRISTQGMRGNPALEIELLPGSKIKKVDGIRSQYPRFIFP